MTTQFLRWLKIMMIVIGSTKWKSIIEMYILCNSSPPSSLPSKAFDSLYILHFWSYMKRAFNIYKLANEKSDIYVTVQRSRSFGNFVKIFLMKKLSLKRVRIIFFRSINHQDSTQSHPLINLLFYSGTGTIFFASLHFKSARQKLTEKR